MGFDVLSGGFSIAIAVVAIFFLPDRLVGGGRSSWVYSGLYRIAQRDA